MKFEIIGARQLELGDIFYCTPNQELNEFGPDALITGTDQILIMDDEYDEGNRGILVNGGRTVWFKANEKVVRLAHYGDMIRVIEMVKEGNPDMAVGPNDNGTLIDDFITDFPDMQIDLLAELDALSDDKESDKDNDKEIDDEDLSDLPF